MPEPRAHPAPRFDAAAIELPCDALAPALDFYRHALGFRLDEIFPADDPDVAELSGHGLRMRLVRKSDRAAGTMRLQCAEPVRMLQWLLAEHGSSCTADAGSAQPAVIAPNGTRIVLASTDPPLEVPPVRQSLAVSRMTGADAWRLGRAGMLYRDLIPDRQGGRFIASHIRIAQGGPVPDWVHYHKVRFQMIYCYRGWVRLVYEDQGEPFVMQAGDCVLQPPQIRHRVIESGDGLEVVEVGCPARHRTLADHALALPTAEQRPQRLFDDQRFALHRAAGASWGPCRLPGFEARDFGFGAATGGIARAGVIRRKGALAHGPLRHRAEFCMLFVLQGGLAMRFGTQEPLALGPGDCCTVPAGLDHAIEDASTDLECLEVMLPAEAGS